MPRPSKTIYRDDDDRPRRKAEQDGPPVTLIVLCAVGALVVVAGIGTAGWFILGRSAPPPPAPQAPVAQAKPETGPGRKPPTGWTDVRDTEGGYQVFLPGSLAKGQPQLAGPLPQGVQMTLYAGTGDKVTATARSIKPAGPIPTNTTPEQMLGWLPSWNIGTDANSEIESKTPVTLGGKPGLLVRVKEKHKDYLGLLAKAKNGQLPEANPNEPQEIKDALDLIKEYQQLTQEALKKKQDEENARPVRHELYFVTSDGKRVIVLHLKQTGEYPDEGTLTTVTGSFEFL